MAAHRPVRIPVARPAFNVSDRAGPAGRPGSSCISVHPIPWLDRIEASVMVEISAAARPMLRAA